MAQPQTSGSTLNSYETVRDTINALLQKREFKPALEVLIRLHDTFPADLGLLDDMATCYWGLGDHRTAIELTSHIVKLSPANPVSWGKLGAMCVSVGDTNGAEAAFSHVLKLNPKSVPALAALNRIRIFERKSHRAKTLRKQAENRSLTATDRATALNALGRIEESAGNFRVAFHFFAKSKLHRGGSFDAAGFDRYVADQVQLFKGCETTPVDTDAGPRFVFVVGLPRSGSTLVESILCRHPEVQSAGESPALQITLKTCRQQIARTSGISSGWDWVGELSEEMIQEYRTLYRQNCLQGFAADPAPVIIDKLPFNCFEIGFAQTLFPDARFIFMSRHPLDTGLSNFTTNFHAAHAFSKRLETIGQMTRAVYRSLEDYEVKIGPALRRQSYSALVTTPEPQIRALLDHTGLPWDPACLSPEKGDDIVRTASLMQVRSPITTSALGKWRRYEAELAPLVKALGGCDWIDAWQAADANCAEATG